jgi:antitoxin (DNA-binding transcriptional repressor) of toxin-antitoxin stability system
MNASSVDLRYKTREILKAIERRETVSVLYRGRLKARIVPITEGVKKRTVDTELFGMHRHDRRPVAEVMQRLRGGRYRGL